MPDAKMRDLRSQAAVCFLIGSDTDRDTWSGYFEQSGYKVHVFKNPAVFFDFLKEFDPFVVVLETSALRSKLSAWVSHLQMVRPHQAWIAVAPMNQYPILASYQNRQLVEMVAGDQLYTKERLLWALDRELIKWDLRRKKTMNLDFVEDEKQSDQVPADLDTFIYLRARESSLKKKAFSLGVLRLDDIQDIESFWGADILQKVSELLLSVSLEKWGAQNVIMKDQNYIILANRTTSQFLKDVQGLQAELQELGREQFGFKLSISGGVAENFVHAQESQDLRRLAEDACRHMQSKGGGRVGIPKAIEGDSRGDVSQDLG